MPVIEASDHADLFVPHSFEEQLIDLGEVRLNYAIAGKADSPALLLIPGQTESWWGYEKAMPLLTEHFQVFAVDLRGQGRSTWTPGRYTVDLFGGDLVRFIDRVIGRPTFVSGHSSGGIIASWLAAYSAPGQLRGAIFEDAPFFASEFNPSCGPSIRQGLGPLFALWNKYLGDQWSIGDWPGVLKAMPRELPGNMLQALAKMTPRPSGAPPAGPPQSLKEYDPEWGRAFASGYATASSDHATMLAQAKVPALLTHHFREIDPSTGALYGATTDLQIARARELLAAAGQRSDLAEFPQMPHTMHAHDPQQYVRTVTDWVDGLG